MSLLIHNLSRVVGTWRGERVAGAAMDRCEGVDGGWVLVEGERIVRIGTAADPLPDAAQRVDGGGGLLLPSYCDSHTHLVHAGSREEEFVDKIRGLTYEQIARRGGGILASARRLVASSEEELYRSAAERLRLLVGLGTGLIEIKSGYGLQLDAEMKMLRVVARLREESLAEVRATFLGAHAVPEAYRGRKEAYVDHICRDMLPAVAAEGLADFVDVFCDEGFFTVHDTERILEQAARLGMRGKIHADELARSGGVGAGVRMGALSVDHLERAGREEIDLLSSSCTMPALLPGASFFLGMPYAPARAMIDHGLAVALASDYNPGSSPSGDMRMVMTLACTQMRMTPAEALAAATLNGAAALGLGDRFGSIAPGKRANFILTRPLLQLAFIPYAYTTPYIARLFLSGREVTG